VSLVVYAVLRLAAFLVPFGLMMLLPAFHDLWWLAAIFAALIGLSISVLFLRRPLAEAAQSLAARREAAPRARTERELEDELEDAANDDAQRG
jgi:L-lactate permease